MILAGDIGGTKCNLSYCKVEGNTFHSLINERLPSKDYTSLEEVVSAFVKKHNLKVEKACFGIPGPVKDGKAETPNLPWVIETAKLAKVLGTKSVRLINDLEANAYGVPALTSKDMHTLNAGVATPGNSCVISAGTGLGEAGIYWDGSSPNPFPSEGGHCDFAPRNSLEIEMLQYFLKEYGHVSAERFLSGPGIYNIYRFLRDSKHGKEAPWFVEESGKSTPSVTICNAALENRCPLCVKTLDLFCSLYGAEAGNLALKIMAWGGVYVGGGLAPRLLPFLKKDIFMKSFCEKGRLASLMKGIPVHILLNDNAALYGAALCAARKG